MTFEPIWGVRVLGLGHRARHGKDTTARLLARLSNGDCVRYSFADDIYAVCRALHGMTTKDAPLLQRVGVEMRERDPEVWIRAVYTKIQQDQPKVAVITDVRFPNEADFVRGMGGLMVRVSRFDEDGRPFVAPDRDPDHITEMALADDAWWDETITNVSGREGDFVREVESFYARRLA